MSAFFTQAGKPSLMTRIALLMALLAFAGMKNNPLVRLEAALGLSPAPFERFTGYKTLFSGMTEAFSRLAALDFSGALESNYLSIPFLVLAGGCLLTWRFPKVRTRQHEALALALILALSLSVELIHG